MSEATSSDEMPEAEPVAVSHVGGRVLLGLTLILSALNLRPVFASISALLPEVIHATGMSAAAAGALTTLPVACLGLFAPIAPRLAQRIGAEQTLFGVLIVVAIGTAMRGLGGLSPLFLGTAIAGAGIAVGNVLLPALVKRDFASKTALMTGLYTMTLCAGAAAAAGFTLPLERSFGGAWRPALAVWAVPAVAVAFLWLPQIFTSATLPGKSRIRVVGLWRDRLAWQVTFFMGLQSALAYCIFGWLAPILRARGLDGVTAGAVVSGSVMTQVAACLIIPAIAIRCRDQRAINVVLVGFATLALLGFLFLPLSLVWPLAVLQGIGQGGLFAVAMTEIVLRSPDSHVAGHLSGMAQFIGYLLAATGPLLVGVIQSLTGGFAASSVLFIAIGLAAAIAGLGAGRPLHVQAHVERP